MQRDRLLIDEMIDAAERIVELVGLATGDEIASNRDRRDAVLWNFTVLGEAANQITGDTGRGDGSSNGLGQVRTPTTSKRRSSPMRLPSCAVASVAIRHCW